MDSILVLTIIIICLSVFVIGLPIFYGLLLPIIKPSLSKKGSTYLYSFSAGFFMILSTIGFISEGKHTLEDFVHDQITTSPALKGITIFAIVGGVIILTLCLALFVKYVSMKKIDGRNNIHMGEGHSHDHIIYNASDYNPKSKGLAIYLLLVHRVPDGLILGLLASSIAQNHGNISILNIIFLISYIIHVVPEELIMYYRQTEMGISRWKAARNSVFMTTTLVPFIIIGGIVGMSVSGANKEVFDNIIVPLVELVAASFLLFTTVIEFFPEFLHSNIEGKEWYKIIFIFILGIAFSFLVLSFHTHAHTHVH